MITKELLKQIMRFTNIRYAEVKNSVCTNLFTGEIIPIEHLAYQKIPRTGDDLYKLTPATCDGSCEIGKPAKKCIAAEIVSKSKCAVYFLDPFEEDDNIRISYKSLINFLGQ